MTTFVDSSVLLDILTDDPRFGQFSASALREARGKGRLAACEAVIAEIRPAFSSEAELLEFCEDLGLEFEPCSLEGAVLAGAMYAAYLENRGGAKRVIPDFLIAAQARVCGAALLARDRGYYREYFQGLLLVDPTTTR